MSVELAFAPDVLEPAARRAVEALVPVLGVPLGGRAVLESARAAGHAGGRAPGAPVEALLRREAREGRAGARLAAVPDSMGVVGRVLEAALLARSPARQLAIRAGCRRAGGLARGQIFCTKRVLFFNWSVFFYF